MQLNEDIFFGACYVLLVQKKQGGQKLTKTVIKNVYYKVFKMFNIGTNKELDKALGKACKKAVALLSED